MKTKDGVPIKLWWASCISRAFQMSMPEVYSELVTMTHLEVMAIVHTVKEE